MNQNLVKSALSGDEAAQEALFRQHYPPTLRLALGMLGNAQDAEEVAQDSLTFVLTHLDRYDPERAALSTWLYTITVSRCRSKRRRKWLPTVRLADWLERGNGKQQLEHDPTSGPEESLERRERDTALWTAVAQLSAKQREAIALRYVLGLNYPEMAKVLGCSASAAQSRTWLGEKKLQELLPNLAPEAVSNLDTSNGYKLEMIK